VEQALPNNGPASVPPPTTLEDCVAARKEAATQIDLLDKEMTEDAHQASLDIIFLLKVAFLSVPTGKRCEHPRGIPLVTRV
jgi:hypothetical protein